MGAGAQRTAEPVGEYLSRKLAVQLQTDLDEYTASNPDFPVSPLRIR